MSFVAFDPAGVQQAQVGPTFDLAIGYYNPVTQLVKMVGYTVSPSGNAQEGMDVTDDNHLVQIASPNSSDRFGPFPKVSQSDWSKGERQRLYIDPGMFYQSDGFVDVSTPGNLTLFPSILTNTYTLNGTFNRVPLQTDGLYWYAGVKSGSNNILAAAGSTPVASSVANDHEFYDLLYTPFALVGLTNEGLWTLVNTGGGTMTSAALVSETQPSPNIGTKLMAYLDDQVFYIKNNSGGSSYIKAYSRATNATSVLLTATASERYYQCICSSASGIFFATSSNLPFQNFLYSWSGSASDTPTRIGEVTGRVEYCAEALGTVYMLVRNFQTTYATNPSWTLYAIVGSNVSVVDDARWVKDMNFAPTCTSIKTFDGGNPTTTQDFIPMIWNDGRFLYLAWPGLATRRIDLVQGGISQIGSNTSAQANVIGRSFVTGDPFAFVDISSYATTAVVTQYSAAATSGYVVSSFNDFDYPADVKAFRSVDFQVAAALVDDQAIEIAYRLAQADTFTVMDQVQTGTRSFSALFPVGTKGTEVQIRCKLTADATQGIPVVTNVAVLADLGRAIDITVSCRRDQLSRSQDGAPVAAQALSAKDLQANIMNVRNIGGGRGYAYIPDPTQDTGVAAIQFRLADAKRITPNGMAPGLRDIAGELDMEADVALTLVEALDP